MADSSAARQHMLDCQILPNKVTETRVADAIMAVPRELFVPKALRGVAYVDEDLAIGEGRYLMEPMIFARMLQALSPTAEDVALEIGSGSGYGAVVLSKLVQSVVGVEESETLLEQANSHLNELGVDNAAVVQGALAAGYVDQAPYDAILINGAVEILPELVLRQIADGGRLVAVVRQNGIGRAAIYVRNKDTISSRILFDAQIPMLPGFAEEKGFVF